MRGLSRVIAVYIIASRRVQVDACCMWFVKNPEWYDTIVVPNMFGDIITDIAAMIQARRGAAGLERDLARSLMSALAALAGRARRRGWR